MEHPELEKIMWRYCSHREVTSTLSCHREDKEEQGTVAMMALKLERRLEGNWHISESQRKPGRLEQGRQKHSEAGGVRRAQGKKLRLLGS